MNLKDLQRIKEALLGYEGDNLKEVKMPLIVGEYCLIIITNEFAEIAQLEWWPIGLKDRTIIHESGKVSSILATFVEEDRFGNVWLSFTAPQEPTGSAKTFEVRIPAQAIITIISNPTKDLKEKLGFKSSK